MEEIKNSSKSDTIKAITGILWVLVLAVPFVGFGREMMDTINSLFGINISPWSLKLVFVVFVVVGAKVIFIKINNKYG